MQAYCMKCRNKMEMKNTTDVTFKNGSEATQGVCHVCNTKIYRLMNKKVNESLVLPVEVTKAIIIDESKCVVLRE